MGWMDLYSLLSAAPQMGLVAQYTPAAGGAAYNNLLQILQSQGKTDPRLMNAMMGNIQRSTQAAQQGMQARQAATGMQGSGVGSAIQAALANAGASRQSDLLAREAQLQEERKRSDLGLYQQLLMQPSQQYLQNWWDQYNQSKALGAQKNAAMWGAGASLAGSLIAKPW